MVSLVNESHVRGTLTDREFKGRPSLMRQMLTVLPADRHDWKGPESCGIFVVRDYETTPRMTRH
jgi:hypothetical protein